MNPQITVRSQEQAKPAARWVMNMIAKGLAAGSVVITLGREHRSLDQNAKMWAMLADVARQEELVINGERVKALPEDWKDVFTAALRRENRLAVGIDGGVVFLGMRTSRMKKAEFRDLIEIIYQYGAENKIHWSEPSLAFYEEICGASS